VTEPAANPTELPAEIEGGTVLAFLNEVAGGRKLLGRLRELVDAGAEHIALAAPQNQPVAGQIVDVDETRDGALSRVQVTQSILDDFGLTASASIFDPTPALAFDDAVRAFAPAYVLFSSLPETRFGLARKDLIEWARSRTDVPVEHVPVRIEDDAIRWDVTHTLVIATQTVNAPDLVEHLIALHRERPHRYTFISPASGDISREEVCDRLAATMAALYRAEADATGQPMGGSEPFAAVRNAIEHYRVDDILVSTLAGRESKWLAAGLLERIEAITDDPITHFEAGAGARAPESVPVGAGSERGEA
jgi:hypothetical protein